MIAFLTSGNPSTPNHWFHNLYKALNQLPDAQVQILRPNLVKLEELWNYDLIISQGYYDVFDSYLERTVDPRLLIIDRGYSNRWTPQNPIGTFQVGINRLNWLPGVDVDTARPAFKISQSFVSPDRPILICGQAPGDMQHRLAGAQLYKWYEGLIQRLKEKHPEKILWFRNHPSSKQKFWFPDTTPVDDHDLEHYLGLCSEMYTYNSTSGIEALMKGIPVFCSPESFYAPWCGCAETLVAKTPTQEELEGFNYRLGYSQWTDIELGNLELLQDYLSILDGQGTPKSWTDFTPPPPPPSQQDFDLACQIKLEVNFPKARKMAKNLWEDRKFVNRRELDAHCDTIIYNYKQSQITDLGGKDGPDY